MAMSKKESEKFEAVTELARVNRALRWSDYDSTPDLPTPHGPHFSFKDQYVNGWSVNAYDKGRVYKSWSTPSSHGEGWIAKGEVHQHGSQKGIAQYSTQLNALKALRTIMEGRFARKLADLDEMIKEEMSKYEDS